LVFAEKIATVTRLTVSEIRHSSEHEASASAKNQFANTFLGTYASCSDESQILLRRATTAILTVIIKMVMIKNKKNGKFSGIFCTIACLIKDKTQEITAGNVSDRFTPSLTLRAAILKPHFHLVL